MLIKAVLFSAFHHGSYGVPFGDLGLLAGMRRGEKVYAMGISRWSGAVRRLPLVRRIPLSFLVYAFVGGCATFLDWSSFYVLSVLLDVHYQVAVAIATLLGGTSKFVFNRIITFKSTTRRLPLQYGVFLCVMLLALGANLALMYIFVEQFAMQKMAARILTTFLVLFLNYALDKNITFSKRLFHDG